MIDCAIVLAGGRGTRLGSLTDATPKPLLPVAGRPFLAHVLDYLVRQGITRVVLATGYRAQVFEQSFGHEYRGLAVTHSPETEPLGTGGAIALALTRARVDAPHVLVLNGDTYFPADLTALAAVHAASQARLSMVLRRVPDVSRYGRIALQRNAVAAMDEKGGGGPGLINGGTYLLSRAAFRADAPAGAFSLERDLLPRWIARRSVAAVVADDYFIDIGVPADLQRAQQELAESSLPGVLA